ncbi:MAG: hypothetical protein F6J93_15280 [Oscillatoria sp. SIO1A7]|nr:hypothetical protein [Oscillatoria sp. SIO1A7]
MTIEEVLVLISAKRCQNLTPLQKAILHQTWEGLTYSEMAAASYYGEDYLKKVAVGLWRLLSHLFNEPISKKNFRLLLEHRPLTPEEEKLVAASGDPDRANIIEFSNGPLALNSPFYIQRSPIEELAYAAIAKPRGSLRLKAPRQMGKTSLLVRILGRARELGFRTVSLNLREADLAVFSSLDRFLAWFCAAVTRKLQLPSNASDRWIDALGSKSNCSAYFEDCVLSAIEEPLVLALEQIDELFFQPEVAQFFCFAAILA